MTSVRSALSKFAPVRSASRFHGVGLDQFLGAGKSGRCRRQRAPRHRRGGQRLRASRTARLQLPCQTISGCSATGRRSLRACGMTELRGGTMIASSGVQRLLKSSCASRWASLSRSRRKALPMRIWRQPSFGIRDASSVPPCGAEMVT